MEIAAYVEQAKSGRIDIVEHTRRFLEECKRINERYNYFTTIFEELALSQAEEIGKNPHGKLCGVPVSIKDCICVKGVESKAGSKILQGYKPSFNATVVEKIIKEGGIIVGKTSQDEFGFGSFSTNTEKPPRNPFDPERVCGGSSGGSAGITTMIGFPHLSISESTGGSIVNPAAFSGCVGLCPTYGRVSRNGLIDYANSLDKIGPMAKSVDEARLALSIIEGHDTRDSTSIDAPPSGEYHKELKVGVIKEGFSEGTDPEIGELAIKRINKMNFEEVSLDLSSAIPAYYIIAMAEASTNLARLCGMRYGASEPIKGNFNEYFSRVRSKYFSEEAKRRIILGTFARVSGFREAFYLKALRARTRVIKEYKKLFSRYDLLVTPTMPVIAPRFDEVEKLTPLESYKMDFITVGPNLGGFPHMSVPIGKVRGMPVGLMMTADHLCEDKLLAINKIYKGISLNSQND